MLIPINAQITAAEIPPETIGAIIVGLSSTEQAELFCALGYQATIVSWWPQQCHAMARCISDKQDVTQLIHVLETMLEALKSRLSEFEKR
jgi:hypothetical protein